MNQYFANRIKFLFVSLFLVSGILTAQNISWKGGQIIPFPPREPMSAVSLQSEEAKVIIDNGIAVITKNQTFKNNSHQTVKGEYLFPIPHNAFINDFSLYIDKERINGTMVESSEAKKIFEDIVRKYKDPALLELINGRLYKAAVFPFQPYGERKIQIKYSQILQPAGDTYKFTYSLSKTETKNKSDLSLQVEIKNQSEIKNIYSPTHNISINPINNNHAAVIVNYNSNDYNSDFILYYSTGKNEIDIMSLAYDESETEKYFFLQLSPKLKAEQDKISEKNIIFVLDISGSMIGEKIKQAKASLSFCIKALNKKDVFSILTFNSDVETIIAGYSASDPEKVKEALNLIAHLSADGGTNLNSAAIKAKERVVKNKPNYIIFLTDGLPTVGVRHPDKILSNIKENYPAGTRFFCFGIGSDVDAFLLDKISDECGGSSNYVLETEDLEITLSHFFSKISYPVLTDCELTFSNINLFDMYPKTIPDLFANNSIYLFGRFSKNSAGKVTLKGKSDNKIIEYSQNIDFSNPTKEHSFIPKLWASRKIAFLLNEITADSDNKELIDAVIKLSKQYGIITPYTSYLVLEDERNEFSQSAIIPKKELVNLSGGYNKISSEKQSSIIRQSQTINSMKSNTQENTYSSFKNINEKSFRLENGYWVDLLTEESKNQKYINIEFASPEYFKLIESDKEIIPYLTIGNKVRFVFKNQGYIID